METIVKYKNIGSPLQTLDVPGMLNYTKMRVDFQHFFSSKLHLGFIVTILHMIRILWVRIIIHDHDLGDYVNVGH